MYNALGVKNVDQILPPPPPPAPKDPSLEHIDAMAGKPFQAFSGQDHRAHITSHLNFMSTNMVRNNPAIMASIQKKYFRTHQFNGSRTNSIRVQRGNATDNDDATTSTDESAS